MYVIVDHALSYQSWRISAGIGVGGVDDRRSSILEDSTIAHCCTVVGDIHWENNITYSFSFYFQFDHEYTNLNHTFDSIVVDRDRASQRRIRRPEWTLCKAVSSLIQPL